MSKPKIEKEQLYIALMSFATGNDIVKRGAKLRGDNPLVRLQPFWWVPVDSSDEEVHAAMVAADDAGVGIR